ncbi:hypothetical protein LQ327_24480 [Actinomycetospora endophytica]|uniref:Uncharacterized protein n=1 Tax=Actinomycetospora endophytica TaxID=2291215 RepID=A0ABS8PE45_9PSEU|nr:hypothetical protein [Actinomycetospora endophytica]MCD2196536.1 hypothetical protein [Actinomycetospora endophytica]
MTRSQAPAAQILVIPVIMDGVAIRAPSYRPPTLSGPSSDIGGPGGVRTG